MGFIMSDEELEQDELEGADEADEELGAAPDDDGDSDDEVVAPVAKKSKKEAEP